MTTGRPMLLVTAGEATPRWLPAFAQALPELHVVGPELPADPAGVAFVAAWRPPPGLFARLPGLRAVFALGAGVDAFLARDDLPPEVPLCKLADAGMAEQMLEFVLPGVLAWQRRTLEYAELQRRCEWRALPARSRGEVRVGVLGLGRIGARVAAELARMGYRVSGWSRGAREVPGVDVRSGADALPALLACSDVLVNLLPSTPETRGLLDGGRLRLLPRGAHLVQASRGDQLDSGALLALLDSGQVGGAWLDVFATEPLPADSPLWSHPRVVVTPHVAAITLVAPAVEQVARNIRALLRGGEPEHTVGRARGY